MMECEHTSNIIQTQTNNMETTTIKTIKTLTITSKETLKIPTGTPFGIRAHKITLTTLGEGMRNRVIPLMLTIDIERITNEGEDSTCAPNMNKI